MPIGIYVAKLSRKKVCNLIIRLGLLQLVERNSVLALALDVRIGDNHVRDTGSRVGLRSEAEHWRGTSSLERRGHS